MEPLNSVISPTTWKISLSYAETLLIRFPALRRISCKRNPLIPDILLIVNLL
jgi:hypothetical protein